MTTSPSISSIEASLSSILGGPMRLHTTAAPSSSIESSLISKTLGVDERK